MIDDPFSDVLRLIDVKSLVSGSLVAGGAWAIRFPASRRMNFWGIVKGDCWYLPEGSKEPFRLEAGDFLLRTAPQAAVLATDLQAMPLEFDTIAGSTVGNVRRVGLGDEFLIIGGKVDFDARLGASLLGSLPSVVLIRRESEHAPVLQALLSQLVRERTQRLPGVGAASSHLAQLMFIQILRAHLDSDTVLAPGWLRVLGHERLAPAVQLLHGEPSRAWGVEELARACNMSRATFAVHFKANAGVAPLAYLAQLRMRLAERALREDGVQIAAVAYSLGYASESAFSNAFKRLVGEAPSRYRASAKVSRSAA